jgi:hypothetical protein
MRVGEIRQFFGLQAEGQSLMRAAMTQLNLSARADHRILKLARTIADLAGSVENQSVHLAEALQYRPKLMMGWRLTQRRFPKRLRRRACDLMEYAAEIGLILETHLTGNGANSIS